MDIEQISAAIVTGVLTGIAVWYRDRRRDRLLHAVPAAATAQVTQSEILTQLVAELGANRALLLKAHNGGQVPHGGRDLKVTIISESEPPTGTQPVAGDYQARPITDTEYRQLIADLDQAELLLIRTEDLTPGSMLRDELELDGARSAWGAVVRRTPERWYYMVVSSRHRMSRDARDRAMIRTAAAKLARLVMPI